MVADNPADPVSGCGSLGEGSAGDDARIALQECGRSWPGSVKPQVAVDIIFDQRSAMIGQQVDQFSAVAIRHRHAQRVTKGRGKHAGFYRVFA